MFSKWACNGHLGRRMKSHLHTGKLEDPFSLKAWSSWQCLYKGAKGFALEGWSLNWPAGIQRKTSKLMASNGWSSSGMEKQQ